MERFVQKQVDAAVETSLDVVVKEELRKYYGRENFSDPAHQSGWFRVDDFLTWVQKNAKPLENEKMNLQATKVSLKQIYTEPKMWSSELFRRAFWVYLGGRYIADVYGVKADFSRLSINFCEDMACAIGGTGMIYISPKSDETIPATINMGMHETTHLLPYLQNGRHDALSELATFYTQYNYALPVRAQDARSLADGVRDFRRIYQLRSDLPLLYEYNYFVVGEILNPAIRPADIFTFTKDEVSGTILDACFNLVVLNEKKFFIQLSFDEMKDTSSFEIFPHNMPSAMKKYHFTQADVDKWQANPETDFYLGKFPWYKLPMASCPPALRKYGEKVHVFVRQEKGSLYLNIGYISCNKKEYMERFFGKKAAAVSEFYNLLATKLPKDFSAEVKATFPTLTTDTFVLSKPARQKRKALAEKYKAVLEKAVIEALEESGTPPPPAIPEGYL